MTAIPLKELFWGKIQFPFFITGKKLKLIDLQYKDSQNNNNNNNVFNEWVVETKSSIRAGWGAC